MQERKGVVESKGNPLTLIGNEIKVGDEAPDFAVLDLSLKPIKLSDYKGKIVVISSVPSLDTLVCDMETKTFNEEAANFGGEIVFLTISMDLPFAQKRWAEEAEVRNINLASDHKDASFGMAYGVLIKELRLLARTIFIIGKDGKVKYVQYVKDTGTEPDYDEVMAAVSELL